MKLIGKFFGIVALMLMAAAPAQAACWQWSTTAGNNATADPSINWADGMSPSSVNDSARAMMARLAECRDDLSGFLLTTGTSTAYAVTTNQGLNATPNDGQSIAVRLNLTNGVASTLAADGGNIYPIQTSPGSAVGTGVLVAGTPYRLTFNLSSAAWVLQDFYSVSIGANSITTSMIQNAAVTYAKMQNVAANSIVGNATGSPAAPADIAVTGPLAVSGGALALGGTNTAHGLAVFEGTSPMGNTGAGTAGQFLISNGASADPSFKSGGWVLLNTLTAGTVVANLQDTTSLTASYNDYLFVYENLIPASTTTTCEIQVMVSGSPITSSTYLSAGTQFSSSAVASMAGPTNYIPCSGINLTATANGVSGEMTLHNYNSSNVKQWTGTLSFGNPTGGVITGYWNSGTAFTGLQWCFSNSQPTCNINIASGSIKIYGRL